MYENQRISTDEKPSRWNFTFRYVFRREFDEKQKNDVSFCVFLQEFSEEAETIFEKSARMADLHRVYKKLVESIFIGIENSASAMTNDAKTPNLMIKLGETTKKNVKSKSNVLFFFRKLSPNATFVEKNSRISKDFFAIFPSDIIGINKLTALDVEKQEAKKNYNTAKAEYEREYCGFPFERLHVR